MTTAAAFRDKNGALGITADLAVTANVQFKLSQGKMYRLGGLIVAVAGLMPPDMPDKEYSGDEAGVREFANDFRNLIKEFGHGGTIGEEGINVIPIEAIVVARGHDPWWIGVAGGIVQPNCGYVAIGSGMELAIGAMNVAKRSDADAETALAAAMAAAADHDPNTSHEFHAMIIPPPDPEEPKKRTRTKRDPTNARSPRKPRTKPEPEKVH